MEFNVVAFFIAIFALVFSIYSFYWMNWRDGDLLIGSPRSYAALSKDSQLAIFLPFVFYNSGPKPKLIENLQLKLLEEDIDPLFFNSTVTKLQNNENQEIATQFPLDGNKTLKLICEFRKKDIDFKFENKAYKVVLEARINEEDWAEVKRFALNISMPAAVALSTEKYHYDDNHV